MRVLIACEYSGRTRRAFEARGHEIWSCDLLPAEDNSPQHIIDDVFNVIDKANYLGRPFDLMVAHPPCTYLANSGVRWLRENPDRWIKSGPTRCPVHVNHDRYDKMVEGAVFFARLLNAPIPRVACENPVMHGYAKEIVQGLLPHDGYPTHFVQPWWFGDEAFKATGFTLKGLPPLIKPATALVPPKPGTPEHKKWSVIHNASPGPDRWKERSRTFPGIARAMAETWG